MLLINMEKIIIDYLIKYRTNNIKKPVHFKK